MKCCIKYDTTLQRAYSLKLDIFQHSTTRSEILESSSPHYLVSDLYLKEIILIRHHALFPAMIYGQSDSLHETLVTLGIWRTNTDIFESILK